MPCPVLSCSRQAAFGTSTSLLAWPERDMATSSRQVLAALQARSHAADSHAGKQSESGGQSQPESDGPMYSEGQLSRHTQNSAG